MNKKSKNTTDASSPYRTMSLEKIVAPIKANNSPKSHVIKATTDLRTRGGK